MSATTKGYVNWKEEVHPVAPMDRVAIWLGLDKTLTSKPNQLRGACPVCKGSDSFRITFQTPDHPYGVCNCFKCDLGGDQIELLSRIRGNPRRHVQGSKDAAEELLKVFGAGTVRTVNSEQFTVRKDHATSPPTKGYDAKVYASRLDPQHEALSSVGLEPATIQHFGAGYSAGGLHRKRLAIQLNNRKGEPICHFGRALNGEQPTLLFPDHIKPHEFIFNADRVTAGELYLVRDPLQVLKAHENGITNCVAFLGPITAQNLEMLSSLMDERKVESVELF